MTWSPPAARVLGIETSCDETAAAVVEDGRRILSNVVSTQVALHAPYGGVVPELASRHHLENIVPVVIAGAMADAGVRLSETSTRSAVTQGPGLVGSLLVGAPGREGDRLRARQAAGAGPPHRRPHRGAPFLAHGEIPLPALALVVSGRPHEPLRGARARASIAASAARATTRPARPSTRWRSSWASAIRADRSIDRLAAERTTARVEFTVARIKDGSEPTSRSAASRPRCCCHVQRDGHRAGRAIPRTCQRAVRDLVASVPARAVVTALVRGLRARRPGAPPAQPDPDGRRRREHAAARARPQRARDGARAAALRPADRAHHRQRGDDRARPALRRVARAGARPIST